MLVPRCVFALHEVCDAEPSRYQLDGILLRRTPDEKPEAIVTDGRRLVCCRWEEPERHNYGIVDGCDPHVKCGDFVALLHQDICRQAYETQVSRSVPKLLRQYVAIDERWKEGELLALSGVLGRRAQCLWTSSSVEPYPKTEDIWASARNALCGDQPTISVSLRPTLLADTLRTMQKACGAKDDETGVIMTIAAGLDESGKQRAIDAPVLLTMRGAVHDVAAVVMPVACDDPADRKEIVLGWLPTYESPTDDSTNDV